MKVKVFLIKLCVCLGLSLSLISCKDAISRQDLMKNQGEYVTIKVQTGNSAKVIEKADYSIFMDATYILSGTEVKDEGEEGDSFSEEFKGAEALSQAEIVVKASTWNFSLVVTDPVDSSVAVLSALVEKQEISLDNNTISFQLEFCEDTTAKGSLNYKLNIPCVRATAFATLKNIETGDEYSQFVSSEGYKAPEDSSISEGSAIGDGVSDFEFCYYFNDIDPGLYNLTFTVYTDYTNENTKLVANTYSSERFIHIYPCLNTTGYSTIEELNKNYSITYKDTELSAEELSEYELPELYANYEAELLLPALKREGYTFDGWYLYISAEESLALEKVISEDEIVSYSLNLSEQKDNLVLYPVWIVNVNSSLEIEFPTEENVEAINLIVEADGVELNPDLEVTSLTVDKGQKVIVKVNYSEDDYIFEWLVNNSVIEEKSTLELNTDSYSGRTYVVCNIYDKTTSAILNTGCIYITIK